MRFWICSFSELKYWNLLDVRTQSLPSCFEKAIKYFSMEKVTYKVLTMYHSIICELEKDRPGKFKYRALWARERREIWSPALVVNFFPPTTTTFKVTCNPYVSCILVIPTTALRIKLYYEFSFHTKYVLINLLISGHIWTCYSWILHIAAPTKKERKKMKPYAEKIFGQRDKLYSDILMCCWPCIVIMISFGSNLCTTILLY